MVLEPSFVTSWPADGRSILVRPHFNPADGHWCHWTQVGGVTTPLHGTRPVNGSYYASACEDPSRDLPFELGTVVAQHHSHSRVARRLEPIEGNLLHMASIMETYGLLVVQGSALGPRGYQVAALLDYSLVLARSMYDLTNAIARDLLPLVTFVPPHEKTRAQEIPSSFAQVVAKGKAAFTPDEIEKRFTLPRPFAEFYASHATEFLSLRALRDAVTHHGAKAPLVVGLDEGPAVMRKERPWRTLPIWNADTTVGDFGSARAIIAYMIQRCTSLLDDFAAVLQAQLQHPPAVAPGLRLFLRSPFGNHLVDVGTTLSSPWEFPPGQMPRL